MGRITAAMCAATLVAGLALAACSTDDTTTGATSTTSGATASTTTGAGGMGGGSPTSTASSAEVVAWQNNLCQSLTNWQQSLANTPDVSSSQSVAEVRTALSTYLQGAISATNTLVTQLRAQGPPPVPDGPAIQDDVISTFTGFESALTQAQQTVQQLPSDPAAFVAQGGDISGQIGAAANQATTTLNQLPAKYPQSAALFNADQAAAC